VVLSRRLLEVYDRTIAPAWNARRLPAGLSLVGVEAPVRIGLSISPGRTEPRVEEARLRLAGLSDRVPIYALAVPLATVRRLHQEYGKPDAGYSQVTLLAARPDDVPALAAAVRRMGFSLDASDRVAAERIGAVVAVTTGALLLLSLLMVSLSALAVAQSLFASVRGRVREVAILEALGATPGDVRRLVLAQGALVGLAGGAAGLLLGLAAARGADLALARLLSDLPFRPETLFAFPAWLLGLAVLLPALSAVIGALAPAAAAARVDPARAIS
jgi:ABC-type antimicrobial peptide transport system permease subunit